MRRPLVHFNTSSFSLHAPPQCPPFRGGRNQSRRGYSNRPFSGGDRGQYVTGDSHIRSVQDANLGFRQGGTGYHRVPPPFTQNNHFRRARAPPPSDHNNQPYRPHQQFRPPQQSPRPHRPQKPLDYRSWEYAKTTPPPNSEKFIVLSYNILADYLANDHRSKLYNHIPRHMMDWQWRKKNLIFELGLWSADIMCFQEVDRFQELQDELRPWGYSGLWKVWLEMVLLILDPFFVDNLENLENLSLTELDEAIPETENTAEDDSTFLSALHNTGDGFASFASDPPNEMFPALTNRIEDVLSSGLDSETVGVEQSTYDPSLWTPMEIEIATGSAECTLLKHPLKLRSTYTEVEDCTGTRDSNGEPLVTSYNRCFFGTVDYIWRSKGLQTVRVLAPIPKHAMQWTSGFPTRKWGSDHIALATELVFMKCSDQS